MRPAALLAGLAVALLAALAHAQDDGGPSGQPAPAAESVWELAATAYWNMPRNEDDYGSGIFTANRDTLHLEARVDYEAIGSQSAFAGWNFSSGESIKFDVTPMLGAVTGAKRGPIAGLESTVAYGRLDYYIEAEYVRDLDDRKASYFYAWSELGFRPVEWLRAGVVAQRSRVYGEARDIQRGGFAQLSIDKFTLGTYWFNIGSSEEIGIVSLGAAF
jgi:hypothetical protein